MTGDSPFIKQIKVLGTSHRVVTGPQGLKPFEVEITLTFAQIEWDSVVSFTWSSTYLYILIHLKELAQGVDSGKQRDET